MSQLNRNLNYLTVVDGVTPWEKLRVIRNFLRDRRIAFEIAKLNVEKSEATLDKNSWQWKEHLIMLPQILGNIEDAKREIKFLEEIEQRLIPIAEAERIPGKTDEEMYEINYVKECAEKLAFEATAERASVGYITTGTMKQIICNPVALQRVIELKLLVPEALQMADTFKQPLPFEENKNLLGLSKDQKCH